MIVRTLLPLISLFLMACAPIIKPVAVSPTATAQATGVPTKAQVTLSPAPLIARVTAAQSLNVRVRPGEREAVTGYLYHGDTVTLTNRCSNGWAQIEWKGAVAWVRAKYLSDNKCEEE